MSAGVIGVYAAGGRAGVIGVYAAGGLLRRPAITTDPAVRRSALAGLLAIVAAVAHLAPSHGADGLRGR